MPDWKETNIDLSLLIALMLALTVITGGTLGFLSWMDTRIDERVQQQTTHLEYRLSSIESSLIEYKRTSVERHKEVMDRLNDD